MIRVGFRLVLLVLLSGCALYSEVVVSPLLVPLTNIDHGSDLGSMLHKADYVRAIEQGPSIDAKRNRTAAELLAVGQAEAISGSNDAARRHLRAAVDLNPFRSTLAEIAWTLSEVEFQTNNYDASLEWARIASDHGIIPKQWHVNYLTALANVNVYRFSGASTERVTLHIGHPDVPRVDVTMNGTRKVTAIVDSGAVLSIMSRSLASALPVRTLGNFQGTFFGLLGEPIVVQFGIIDSLQLGKMTIANVPVAIMPDEKLEFLVTGEKGFKMEFLLGANLLKEMRIELDYRRRQIEFTHLRSVDHHPAPDQNLFVIDFRPAVRGFINRRGWFMFMLDTGSEVSFLNEGQINGLPLASIMPKVHNATLQGLGGTKKHGDKIDDVEIGIDKWAGLFKNIPMYEPPPQEKGLSNGILGENFLKNFIVTIDFGRMRVDLTPLTRPDAAQMVPQAQQPKGAKLPIDQ